MANQFREKQVPLMLLVSYGDSSPVSVKVVVTLC
ncbi:Uncharacterised protein [Providencia rustigianii]|nr:Uncharacterised protein [Providencia rustigianii]